MLNKILYVDDCIDDLNFAEREFKNGDIIIKCVNNVADAFKELEENIYTLIVSDILMPDKDGLEFAHALSSKGIDTPIVFISSVPSLSKFAQYTAVKNYKGFVLKPLTIEKAKQFL